MASKWWLVSYSVKVTKYFTVASEVATLAFLRSSGLPAPDNEVETEYTFMGFLEGTQLIDI